LSGLENTTAIPLVKNSDMHRILQIIWILLLCLGCESTQSRFAEWQIESSTPGNTLFEKGASIYFEKDSFRIKHLTHEVAYPMLQSKNRVVIEIDYSKHLFEANKTSENTLKLYELYTPDPIEIILTRKQQIKKHRI
jgi:hypothetical protein